MTNTVNPRKKKLDSICTKIAMFIVQETYTDEPKAQLLLAEAIQKIDAATKLLVSSDERHATEATA